MKEIKNVLIIGLGALGATYATKIHDYNPECLKVLLDRDRLDRYQTDGIIFNKKRYDFDYILESNRDFKADLIIIATKSTTFKQSSRMIRPFVDEGTIIMSLLNGISSEEVLAEKYGPEKILYSYYLGHSCMRQGNEIRHDGIGTIYFGNADNTRFSENTKAVMKFFERVGINYEVPENMLTGLWQKFIINIGANIPLAILKSPFKALKTSLNARNLSYNLMLEAVEIAKVIGIEGANNFIEKAFESMQMIPDDCRPSTLQDLDNKKPTEIDIFCGEVCRLGKKYSVPTPKNALACHIIKALEDLETSEIINI